MLTPIIPILLLLLIISNIMFDIIINTKHLTYCMWGILSGTLDTQNVECNCQSKQHVIIKSYDHPSLFKKKSR